MFSLAKIATFAAVAFGTFAAAAPISADVKGKVSAVVARDDVSVATVLTDLNTKLGPVISQITDLTGTTATVDALKPIVSDVVQIVDDATAQILSLVGKPVEQILAPVEGDVAVTVSDVAELLSTVLHTVFATVAGLLKLVKSDLSTIIATLVPIVDALLKLIQAVLTVVGGILGDVVGALVGLVGDLVPVILHLNVAGIISLLGL